MGGGTLERRIRISAGPVTALATLNSSETAARIWETLPITGRANTWGDEIYFSIPVGLEEAADAVEDVEVGDLGYWAPGTALCIFFGPTPVSIGPKPRAASPVNVFGRIVGDAAVFSDVPDGAAVTVEQATGRVEMSQSAAQT
ncbi:MAG: hypothetical protein GX620_02445 [Chloroflexi bacterium]|nr:hypothetical protein [Chloroflexota bacterium]